MICRRDETDEEAEPEAAVNELTARNQANQIPESVYSGQPVPDLDNVSYYILLLSGANSRVMIRRYDRGSYPDLRRNLGQWYADLALTNQGGTGNIRPVKLAARLLRLLKFQKTDSRPFERLSKELAGITPAVVQAILSGRCLPDAVAAKALAYIRSELLSNDDSDTRSTLPNSLGCQWLKVWLLRKNRIHHQEGTILEAYNLHLRQCRISLRRIDGRICGDPEDGHAGRQYRHCGAVLRLRHSDARAGHRPAQQPLKSPSGKDRKRVARR